MTLTLLSDDEVKTVLENLNREELDGFREALASALHEFSTNSRGDEEEPYQQPHRIITRHPSSKATTLYMPSCGPEGMGCKVVSLTTPNVTLGDPEVKDITPTGVVNLFSPDGSLIGVVHASTLTAFRTALASACLLARRSNVRTITVYGSGSQAYWHVRLALMMRGSTIRHVNVVNRRFSGSATSLLKRFSATPAEVRAREGWMDTKFAILTPTFHDYERLHHEYLLGADVIYCCTPSQEDLFDGSVLTSHEGRKRGRLIVAVGSFTPEMRELPEALLRQATKTHDGSHRHFHKHAEEGGAIVVDTLEGALKEAGEIIAAKIPPRHLVELGELVMLRRQAAEESESDTLTSQTSASTASEPQESGFGHRSGSSISEPRSDSPTMSSASSHKSGFRIPFRNQSNSPSRERAHEDALGRWLREGTVIYKSVGLGLMDLVVGMHLLKVAREKQIGTFINGF